MNAVSCPHLEERYASMTTDQFEAIQRADLTEEAQAAYDKEVARRGTPQWLAKEKQRVQELEASAAAGPVGVGGWLLFFCFSLTVLSPLVTLLSFFISFKEAGPYFGIYPGLKVITVIDTILSTGLMAFSIYAGVTLWRKKRNAVKVAKSYLFTVLVYSIVAGGLVFLAGLPSAANEVMTIEAAKGFFRTLAFFGIWYSYLNQSKRVKATFHLDS